MKKGIILLATFFVTFNLLAQVALSLPEMDLEEQSYYDNWENNGDSFFVIPVKLNEYISFNTLSFNITYDPTVVTPLTSELMGVNSYQYILNTDDQGLIDFAMLESGQITAEVFTISANQSLLTVNYSFSENVPESTYNDYNGNLMYLAFQKQQACYESPLFFNFFNGDVDGAFVNPNQTNAFIIEDLSTENGELITVDGIVNFSLIMADIFQNGTIMESEVMGGTPPYSYNWTNKLNQTLETSSSFSPDLYSDYLLYISDANGCVSSLYFSFEPASIDEFSTLKIYPNPAQESIQIQFDQSEYHYQLLDLKGQIINAGTANSTTTIYRNLLPSGLYFLRIQHQDKSVINKIILN